MTDLRLGERLCQLHVLCQQHLLHLLHLDGGGLQAVALVHQVPLGVANGLRSGGLGLAQEGDLGAEGGGLGLELDGGAQVGLSGKKTVTSQEEKMHHGSQQSAMEISEIFDVLVLELQNELDYIYVYLDLPLDLLRPPRGLLPLCDGPVPLLLKLHRTKLQADARPLEILLDGQQAGDLGGAAGQLGFQVRQGWNKERKRFY